MRLRFTRFIIRVLLRLLTTVECHGQENIPSDISDGNFIIASNHLGLVDAFLPFYILPHNNLVLLVGEKWEKMAIMRWLGRQLNFIFVDRFNPDIKAIRAVIKRMKHGEVLVITPEGTRSKVGHLIEGKPGVSYLAVKMGFPLVPVGIAGTYDEIFFVQLKHFHRPHINIHIGPSGEPGPRGGLENRYRRNHVPNRGAIAAGKPRLLRGPSQVKRAIKDLIQP